MLKAWGEGGGSSGGQSKARYRDGALVSTRGEKYVIEKVCRLDRRTASCCAGGALSTGT